MDKKFKGSVEEQKLWERWKNIVQTLNGAGLTPTMLRAKLPKLPNVPKSSSPNAANSVEFEASPADKKLWDEWLPILCALEQIKITPAQMQDIIDSNTKK